MSALLCQLSYGPTSNIKMIEKMPPLVNADTSVNLGSTPRKPTPIFEEMEVSFEDGLIFG